MIAAPNLAEAHVLHCGLAVLTHPQHKPRATHISSTSTQVSSRKSCNMHNDASHVRCYVQHLAPVCLPGRSSCTCLVAVLAGFCWGAVGCQKPQVLSPLWQYPRCVALPPLFDPDEQCVPCQASCWQDSAQALCHPHQSTASNSDAAGQHLYNETAAAAMETAAHRVVRSTKAAARDATNLQAILMT